LLRTEGKLDRRHFLSLTGLSAAGLAIGPAAYGAPQPGTFDFVFLTDTHLQPELDAAKGCAMCFKRVRSTVKADFVIQGGDHIFDGAAVPRERATSLFDLYKSTEQDLGLKVYHTLGNHDVFGISAKSGIGTGDPGYGKQMYQDRMGPTYYSFDHKGYHFVVLDSIQITPDRNWKTAVDAEQLAWLKKDLTALAPGTPIMVIIHAPLLSGAVAAAFPGAASSGQLVVTNAGEVIALLSGHNVMAVLQGHLHINEVDTFKGIPFVTAGAVCGNWWHGTHEGTPEGYTVVSLRGGKATWRYETYGFKSVDPKNT
jgi:3',5'-cyclic-AMP phosphodiesterase